MYIYIYHFCIYLSASQLDVDAPFNHINPTFDSLCYNFLRSTCPDYKGVETSSRVGERCEQGEGKEVLFLCFLLVGWLECYTVSMRKLWDIINARRIHHFCWYPFIKLLERYSPQQTKLASDGIKGVGFDDSRRWRGFHIVVSSRYVLKSGSSF